MSFIFLIGGSFFEMYLSCKHVASWTREIRYRDSRSGSGSGSYAFETNVIAGGEQTVVVIVAVVKKKCLRLVGP